MDEASISGYRYSQAACGYAHGYLLPAITKVIREFQISPCPVFDLGCGNGSVANWFATQGYTVSGVDPSETGISVANHAFPNLNLRVGSAYQRLSDTFGTFPLVVSLEVIEHVYAPRCYAACVRDLLAPNGFALISTPYHGYLKNLALALTGKMDQHFTALWDHGHIKFWSQATLTQLFAEVGLSVLRIHRVGRVPQLAKTMLAVLQKTA